MAEENSSQNVWPEIEKAEKENRRELVLQGSAVDKKIQSSGGLHAGLYSLSLLNYLEVSQCPSLHEIHENIRNLSHLQSLILCRNKLTSVPKSIGHLKAVKVLDLSVNQLQALPEEICALTELNTLNVSCNSLTALPDGLSKCVKLASINVSKNELSRLPEDLWCSGLELLSSIIASENAIEELSSEIQNLPSLKVLDLSNNKLQELPAELADCPKLKETNFKGNKLKDKRLEKMVNGCPTKSVLDYLRAGGRGKGKGKQQDGEVSEKVDSGRNASKKKSAAKQKSKKEEEDVDELNQMVVRILHISESPTAVTVKVSAAVKDVRPYIVCCIVKGMNLRQGNSLKRFLVAQTKLHDEICAKRTTATIATHDLGLLKYPLLYDARPPDTLKIIPLGRKEVKAVDLLRQLQQEAHEQRKQKKRQNVSGLHKYLQLLDGKDLYPCLVDAEDHVISFPPITNSDKTKIKKTTKELFLEVTSSTSLQICKDVMDALIIKMAELNKLSFDSKEVVGSDEETTAVSDHPAEEPTSFELTVLQVKVVDVDGNLKVVYPSKTDLMSSPSNLSIIR
ncbi:leucine-rich repeat-containing protein 47 [Danio rerio]|uniref:Leucine-rich repeat-containing protein 47 n=1 Tax=Danio rerio TaxID=7955 RepID=A8WFY2_DANRE|nr:leucine-rich repeat-containing protein 47 [Danio rerio]AAI54502.1 Si:ch211-147a11.7 protein [Danio rerio]|eukprot:NP_001103842.1 leucine-rich repeat-containing protein 47 [Danio rerio]